MKVEFYRHCLGKDEVESLLECLDGLFLTTGAYVKEFEDKFASYLGSRFAVGVTSCTAALHLSLLSLGIGPGDEVITTPMTFIATATAILHTGATPVFVDVEEATGLMNAECIEAKITENTKAIIPVHLYGQMCDMNKIMGIAKRHGLSVVEDCAHCIEGEADGIKPGALSDCACFSFYATKNITSGEGGAVVTNREDVAQKVRRLRLHGMSKDAVSRYSGVYQHWDMIECGWKYNMDNIHAALLLPQIAKIDMLHAERQKLYKMYMAKILSLKDVAPPLLRKKTKSAYHLFTILLPPEKRDRVLEKLGNAGIGVAVNYRAIHLLTYFRKKFNYAPGDYPMAEHIGDATISLPFWVNMREKEVDRVVKELKSAMATV